MLCEKGSTFHFEKNSYFTYNDKKYNMTEQDGLFIFRIDEVLKAEELYELSEIEKGLSNDTYENDGHSFGCAATYDLWHQRFGHANKRRIKFLYDNGSVEGLDVNGKFKHDKHCKCSTCVQTNNSKVHIGNTRKFTDEITQIGQEVVSDLWTIY
mmetsp:Transcript_10917/g.14195  ORF Transcript_10917/g.14195 Transcript_10917/m.14195 type:complete len:154 (+) Transcript_10917:768-1229(+)